MKKFAILAIAALTACGSNTGTFTPPMRGTQSVEDATSAIQGVSNTSGIAVKGGGDPVKGVKCCPGIVTMHTQAMLNTTRANIKNSIVTGTF